MANLRVSDDNTLGPYRLVRKLGEGGMGTVYLAFDPQLERHVAIKVLRMNADDPAAAYAGLARRFLREAQSAAKLNHPNVVTIHTVGQQGSGQSSRPFLVMEYVEAGSLADELHKRSALNWRKATEVVSAALLGLEAAHRAGIIHRDIKPANLMRTKSGTIKLVDFGLARAVYSPADAEITYPGAFVGSPSYASPEQIAGNVRLDARSDLYSLAATWYALLAGQPPFVDDDPTEIMRRHMSDAFPDPRELAPHTPKELVAVLQRATAKEPGARFAGAAEMRQAVEGLLTGTPETRASSPTPLPRSSGRANAAHETVELLESQLAQAKRAADAPTQLTALRSLFGLYTQLERPEQARTAFRQALALHVKLHEPGPRMAGV
jgi:serine/threonine protein kinase